jgi:hypothetical protein
LDKLKDYESVANQFKEFFNQEELGALLDRKADLELVCRIQDCKANKTEIQNMMKEFEAIKTKIQCITVF